MRESYLFLQIFHSLFILYIFWNISMFWDQRKASAQSRGKVKKHSEGDQNEQETADTMHNVIIPSGRVQNRQLENQSVAVISLLIQQERNTTYI